jgi:multidrug efflux pump subunit AcrA (membrane-fusion protein)
MPQPAKRPGKRAYLLVSLFTLALVGLPFLFWYQTWFGRKLTDATIAEYLADTSKPRHSQHALVQIADQLADGDTSAKQWYPEIVRLASSPAAELRQTTAWIMGRDHTYGPFHEALRKLLNDPEPIVRRNAALALCNFQDADALGELRKMLLPSEIAAPVAGVVRYRLKEGQFVNPGTLVARVGDTEIRAKLPGEVRSLVRQDGSQVTAGEEIVDLSADNDHALEALKALYVVGRREDLEPVQRYVRGWPGMPDNLREQATYTLKAIQSRAAQN